MRKLLLGLGLAVVLSGCVQSTAQQEPSPPLTEPSSPSLTEVPASPSVTEPAPTQPTNAPAPMESELPPGWDEPQDGAPAPPDSALSADQLLDLLRLTATDVSTHRSCSPDQVHVSIAYVDAAVGSRYGYLTVENTSDGACSVKGYPGFGARGTWGSKFLLIVEQRPTQVAGGATDDRLEVILRPGERASADMVWTGELAGAHAEPISMFVVQLASDQPVIGHPVTREFVGDSNGPFIDSGLDIGMLTTVRVGPFKGIVVGSDQRIDAPIAP